MPMRSDSKCGANVNAHQPAWACPRHSVACECAPPDAGENSALLSLVNAHWKSSADREAVLTKLRDCGIRSTGDLKKCVQTCVLHFRMPRSCWYRGGPPLLNYLISERCDGAKLFRSSTLEAVVKRCMSNDEFSRLSNAIREWSHEKSAVGERELRDVGALLMDSGIYTAADLRCLILFDPHAPAAFQFPQDLRERLGKVLCKVAGCTHQPAVAEARHRGSHRPAGPRCKLHSLCHEGLEIEARLRPVAGLACDSAAEAEQLYKRLRRSGVGGLQELKCALYTRVSGMEGEDGGEDGGETLLNTLLRSQMGRKATVSDAVQRRLGDALRLEVEDGESGVLFTAPHGIWLKRHQHRDHKPEVFTSMLATSLAGCSGSSYAAWAVDERTKSQYMGRPDEANTDPNYSRLDDELCERPWNRVLQRHARRFGRRGLHVDVHGRRDVVGGTDGGEPHQSDVDVGLGAMLRCEDAEAQAEAQALRRHVTSNLGALLESRGYVVADRPHFEGYIAPPDFAVHPGSPTFVTMTMQSVRLGMRAVQLEISLRLRKALYCDPSLRTKFAMVLLDVAAGARADSDSTDVTLDTASEHNTP